MGKAGGGGMIGFGNFVWKPGPLGWLKLPDMHSRHIKKVGDAEIYRGAIPDSGSQPHRRHAGACVPPAAFCDLHVQPTGLHGPGRSVGQRVMRKFSHGRRAGTPAPHFHCMFMAGSLPAQAVSRGGTKKMPCSAAISLMRRMSGPPGASQAAAMRSKKTSKPAGAVCRMNRSGVSPQLR